MAGTLYDAGFYEDQWRGSQRSAEALAPLILELTGARSVVDVGSGIGTWLTVYREQVEDYLGLDGAWVDPAHLLIPSERFRSIDLTQPSAVGRRFDMAQSLEVAEHLPPARAAAFVAFLASLSDVVVFSAALPYQGGTGHVNEQWPGYWRTLFAAEGYKLYDVFRPRLWGLESVDWWYAQNMFLYVREGTNAELVARVRDEEGWVYPERIVHPFRIDPTRNVPIGLRQLARDLRKAVRHKVHRALRTRLGWAARTASA